MTAKSHLHHRAGQLGSVAMSHQHAVHVGHLASRQGGQGVQGGHSCSLAALGEKWLRLRCQRGQQAPRRILGSAAVCAPASTSAQDGVPLVSM